MAPDVPPADVPHGCAEGWKRWKPWVIKNYLVLGFALVITLGMSWPLPGKEVRAFALRRPSSSSGPSVTALLSVI